MWTTCAAVVQRGTLQHLHNPWQLLNAHIGCQALNVAAYRIISLISNQPHRPCRRVFTFLSATDALTGRCVEFSSLVSPAVRAAHLAAFRAGRVQVTRPVTVVSLGHGMLATLEACKRRLNGLKCVLQLATALQMPHSLLYCFEPHADHCKCNSRAQVLVCSDAMTRGMDVENAANVVSYDAPVYAKVRRKRQSLTVDIMFG
jgi:hypothetical protein